MAINKDSADYNVKNVDGNNAELFTADNPGVTSGTADTKTFLTANASGGRESVATTFPVAPAVTGEKITVVGMSISTIGAAKVKINNVTGLTTTSQLTKINLAANGNKEYSPTPYSDSYWFQGDAGHKLEASISSTATTVTIDTIYYTEA